MSSSAVTVPVVFRLLLRIHQAVFSKPDDSNDSSAPWLHAIVTLLFLADPVCNSHEIYGDVSIEHHGEGESTTGARRCLHYTAERDRSVLAAPPTLLLPVDLGDTAYWKGGPLQCCMPVRLWCCVRRKVEACRSIPPLSRVHVLYCPSRTKAWRMNPNNWNQERLLHCTEDRFWRCRAVETSELRHDELLQQLRLFV
jgi:hypothetical protein